MVENSSHLSTGAHPRLEGREGSSRLQTTQNGNIKRQILVDTVSKYLHGLPFSQN